jgi:hypothetical protein
MVTVQVIYLALTASLGSSSSSVLKCVSTRNASKARLPLTQPTSPLGPPVVTVYTNISIAEHGRNVLLVSYFHVKVI